jgi:heme/copper-type cytochrome/quinol oxidase subunit 3
MHDVYIKGEKKKEKRINGFIIFLIVALLLFSIGFFVYSWNPLIFETQANIEKSEEIYPDDSLVINFSKTMLTN